MKTFDPNLPGVATGGYFALPFTREEAKIVLISVPWDVTTSYRPGTHMGPYAMIDASVQIDLFNSRVPQAWKIPIATLPVHEELPILNRSARKMAEQIIESWEEGIDPRENKLEDVLEQVNEACSRMNRIVYLQSSEQLRQGKTIGLVGGEHSVPLGFLQALGEHHDSYGILHIDAHADLREAYEGFTFSHASIMYNALKSIPSISSLTQVGVRDYCQEEHERIGNDTRISFFSDDSLQEGLFEGLTWREQCQRIMESLPEYVYISLDIDGLSPDLCPNTGTPVPGGLNFQQVDYLLYLLAFSHRKIIGFDLCEVAPGEEDPWDAIVGARLLHKICCYCYANNKK
ncbi:MAG: agmatinase family protein [Bacteroidales bacterium]|nr:agmatinase family protein [Bacteroidales bacterium]